VWQASPYNLRLLDAVGPHPLDGGAVMFRVPKFSLGTDGSSVGFLYYMHVLAIHQVRLTMQRRGGDAVECTVIVELHEAIAFGRRLFYPWMIGMTTVAGGAAGAALFVAMMPILAALTTLLTVATVYGGLYKLNHVTYRYYIKTAQEHLEALLADVDAKLRTQAVFGSLPAPRPGPPIF
jgi:hypothetical protein